MSQGSKYVTTAGIVTYQCWSYDSFGNRTFELDSTNPCPAQLTQANSTHWMSFPHGDNKVTGMDTRVGGLSYDAAGNVIQDSLNTYLYDAEGHLSGVKNTNSAYQYVYDADGNRVARGNLSSWPSTGTPLGAPSTANGFTLTYYQLTGDVGGRQTEIYPQTGGWNENIFANGGLLATYTGVTGSDPGLYFTFSDWLGTKRLQVNSAGQIFNYWASDPFGNYLTPHVTGADAANQHYTGQERDTESGNDYFGARYYASSIGRFASPDPSTLAFADSTNPQSLNLYSYVLNNPLIFLDPTGLALQLNCSPEVETATFGNNSVTVSSNDATRCTVVDDGLDGHHGSVPALRSPPRPIIKLPIHSPKCGTKSLLPHSFGLSVGANADLGFLVDGATATGSGGAGIFFDKTGISTGAFASGGAAAYFLNAKAGTPTQQGQPISAGVYAGYGPSGWISNASSVQELGGPFTTLSLNLGAGPVKGSAQLSYGDGIWQFSYGPPIPYASGGTPGVSFSKLTTNTVTTQTGCEPGG